jgi:hypothetical protein
MAVGTDVSKSYGSSRSTFAERWDGYHWSVRRTPSPGNPSAELRAVSCISASWCTAVGDYVNDVVKATLAEHWNGSRWSIQHTLNPSGTSKDAKGGQQLTGISCPTPKRCVAVGEYGVLNLHGHSASFGTLAESWNGHDWSLMRTPTPSSAQASDLNSVSCSSSTACTAVGHYYTHPIRGSIYNGPHFALVERWNGRRWSIQRTPTPGKAVNSFLYGVSCPSQLSCTAVGTEERPHGRHLVLAERWSGRGWALSRAVFPPRSFTSLLSGVSCSGQSACTAVGTAMNGGARPVAERYF